MAEIPLPADLPSLLSDYDRRLRALETAPRLQNAELPWKYATVGTEETCTSATFVDLATAGPIITTDIGQTGQAFITVSAYIVPKNNNYAAIGLFIDGTLSAEVLLLGNGTSDYSYGNVSTTRVVTGLSIGSHEFRLKYRSQNASLPDPPSFAARLLTVQPF